ncbi:pyruvate kinase [Mycolicibacterium chubuense]|uniref:pyruvate kinase n=1 Tax=Mycolicibacterium chubuense TaxID=1800 RepID=A0A0J6WMN1_MYCCU|nr:pyruvate kinase [Mycolicibacterium chubuense]KMO84625.1 Pyruvate kinase [Mycolicibacterium chubuense]ORA45876.1 pyruvate kinase [Mycolicibacterium chubuense]SPY00606.1 pyruvate kinase [Mycolicibacterium chubuense]
MSLSREVGSAAGGDTQSELARLVERLDNLLERLAAAEAEWSEQIGATAPEYRSSARNLAHNWAIREIDLRDVQQRLAHFGLSSLGRSEPHVEATLRLVRSALLAMLDDSWCPPAPSAIGPEEGRELLAARTAALLGPVPVSRETRIMVTLPSEAAADADLVERLVRRGMDVARINCAHDDPAAWRAMAEHVRAANVKAARRCLIAMDLAGPKVRTGPITPGPAVVKLRPHRDALGHVVAPVRAWFTAADRMIPAVAPDMTTVPVTAAWLARRRVGDGLRVRDTRGAKRTLRLTDVADGGAVACSDRTVYLATGTVVRVDGCDDPTEIGALPRREQYLVVRPGDTLSVVRDCTPVPPDAGRIGCTLPEVFGSARAGDRILFDDGRIGATITAVTPDALQVRIDRAAQTGSALRAGKGINVPDTALSVSALTDKDVDDLATAVDIADLVEMSFVQDPVDVLRLHDALDRRGGHHVGIVLKIETRRAFERLPDLLASAMRRPTVGVMIARGDLAVEVGYQRLAEVQEEILWLCEAAHLPVIWATQVLEQLATSGLPSRAEISDAAMGERAECVMLNKGAHIEDAVVVLDDILSRMAEHHFKENALLPQLHSWYPVECSGSPK